MCIHCGHQCVTTFHPGYDDGNTAVLLHLVNGAKACPDGSGHIACLAQIGFE